jgi:hypothetical protein
LSDRLCGCTSSDLREVDLMTAIDRAGGESRWIPARKLDPSVFLPANLYPFHEGRAEEAFR